MHILSLDTTTRAGSAAVARDGTLLCERSGDATRTHGERLPGEIMRTLEEAGVRIADIDLLAVAAGPGSFTGLRVGIAAVQGLAVARGVRVVPVPTLEALARAGRRPESTGELVAAWMDGQRGEVFAALYDGAVSELAAPMAAGPALVLDRWHLPADSPIVFIGDGATRYAALLGDRLGARAHVLAPPPLAATIARVAFEQPHRAVDPHEIVPVYVRRSDAELARERGTAAAAPGSAQGIPHPEAASSASPAATVERASSPQDLDEVAALEAACFTNPWTREMLEREISQSDVARLYVVRDPGSRLIAFCACWLIVDELHINTIAVDPPRRRAGIASLLMRHVMEDSARAGVRRATLEVRASNEAARRLYAGLGFVESGVRARYYTQPEEDAIVLWREI